MLKVINGKKKPSIDYYSMHKKSFAKCCENPDIHKMNPNDMGKAIYHGVKMVNLMNINTVGGVEESLTFIRYIQALIRFITPNQLIRTFPIDKIYDGARWGSKDYFSTMEALNKHGLDTIIGNAVDDILWDYMNMDIVMMQVQLMSLAGKLYHAETGSDMLIDFFEEQGITLPTYSEFVNPATGNKFMMNNDTGEMLRLVKPKSRHLKLIK